MIPPIPGLKGIQYLTNENIFAIEALPKHLVVLGGGPVGLELGQAFRRLGSEVSIIDAQPALLPNDDVEAGRLLEKRFADEGINLHLGSKIVEVKATAGGTEVIIEKSGIVQEVIGDKMLVALGRAPLNIAGLEVAGVKINKRGYIITDRYLRTGIKNIFACGDCAGPYQFTHTAGHQGSIVVRNLILPFKARVDYSAVPWVTYTKPEVAHTGLTEQGAVAKGILKKAITVALGDIDRSIIEGEAGGFLKMIIGNNNRVIGITIVAQKAGEMIASGILAVAKKMRPSVFASVIFPYPTQSEIYKTASYLSLKDAFKPWMRKLVNLVSLR
jgi:pyruvate/2-oxoglutarate dehydrogenase complex dihydrolipoamide dehydrogenase (E3) component